MRASLSGGVVVMALGALWKSMYLLLRIKYQQSDHGLVPTFVKLAEREREREETERVCVQ